MNIEKPILLLFFCLFLFLGVGNFWNHEIQHDFPYGYLASDTFQQSTRTEGIKDAGNYRNEAFYIVKGFRDVIGYYPALIHHAGVLLYGPTGTQTHDTTFLLVFLNGILAAFMMYIIIRSYNKQIALLALPFMLLIFSSKSYIAFAWGHWASVTAQMFLITVMWGVRRFDEKNSFVFLAIGISSLALSHASEFVYGVMFVGIYCIITFFEKKVSKQFIVKMLKSVGIAVVLSAVHLYVFTGSFGAAEKYEIGFVGSEVANNWGGTPIPMLSDYGFFLIPMGIGLFMSIYLFKKMKLASVIGILLLAIGYTNYIGFGIRSFQPRLFWPIYFSFVFGFGIYTILQFAPKKFRRYLVLGTVAICTLMVTNAIAIQGIPTYSKLSSQGLMTSYHWDAYQWISGSTPDDAKLYFFYGDTYTQNSILRNAKRFHAYVVIDDVIASIQNQEIKQEYQTAYPGDHGGGMPYFKQFPKIALHIKEENFFDGLNVWGVEDTDICLFDYFIFDKASRQPQLAQYNLLVANELVNNGNTVVYQNDLVLIIQNQNAGGQCIVKRDLQVEG